MRTHRTHVQRAHTRTCTRTRKHAYTHTHTSCIRANSHACTHTRAHPGRAGRRRSRLRNRPNLHANTHYGLACVCAGEYRCGGARGLVVVVGGRATKQVQVMQPRQIRQTCVASIPIMLIMSHPSNPCPIMANTGGGGGSGGSSGGGCADGCTMVGHGGAAQMQGLQERQAFAQKGQVLRTAHVSACVCACVCACYRL